MTLLSEAILFAIEAHAGQVRKYTGEPYIHHPLEVMSIVAKYRGVTDEMLAAAVLHDVVEDCAYTINDIESRFGMVVATYVEYLTDPEPSFGNRAERKVEVIRKMQRAPIDVHMIKIADLISNAPSIKEHDPSFWPQFRMEKEALLNVLIGAPVWAYRQAQCLILEEQAA